MVASRREAQNSIIRIPRRRHVRVVHLLFSVVITRYQSIEIARHTNNVPQKTSQVVLRSLRVEVADLGTRKLPIRVKRTPRNRPNAVATVRNILVTPAEIKWPGRLMLGSNVLASSLYSGRSTPNKIIALPRGDTTKQTIAKMNNQSFQR